MSEEKTVYAQKRPIRLRHRGRLAQIRIYLGKMLRMFVYENDWKVLPMAALIAALVAMVIRNRFFVDMEGDLIGAFALMCVAIWNGCFNSIQSICRERPIIKREHRSGMHVSSYIIAHMIYQALLCFAQAVLTVVVCGYVGVDFPEKGLITSFLRLDITITLFMIAYASDMLSLWISSLAHSTTTAMTVMPFVLIFQLVFSGGIFQLPTWAESLSDWTISSYGMKCIAAQADYNHAPMNTAWSTLKKMKDQEIGGEVSVGQILDFVSDKDNPAASLFRDQPIDATVTVGAIWETLASSDTYQKLRETSLSSWMDAAASEAEGIQDAALLMTAYEQYANQDGENLTFGDLMDALQIESVVNEHRDLEVGRQTTIGELIDFAAESPVVQEHRDEPIQARITVGQLMEMIGEDKVRDLVTTQSAAVSRIDDYELSKENIIAYWGNLVFFMILFAFLAMLSLEFIDKDKR